MNRRLHPRLGLVSTVLLAIAISVSLPAVAQTNAVASKPADTFNDQRARGDARCVSNDDRNEVREGPAQADQEERHGGAQIREGPTMKSGAGVTTTSSNEHAQQAEQHADGYAHQRDGPAI